MKRFWTAAGTVAALIVAGCTGGDTTSTDTAAPTVTEAPVTEPATTDVVSTEPASTDPVTTEVEGPPAGLTGPAPGVTDTEIKIGITYIDLGSAEVATNHGDYEAAFQAVIDDINSRGGINGRAIVPVFAPISIADGGNADEVCVRLTEDEQVFAVLGFFMGDAPACYLETHQTAILGGTQTPDLLGRAHAPWYAWDVDSDFDIDALHQLAADGYLDGKVGVMAASTDEATINGVILPTLEELGVNVVEVGLNDAPNDDTVLRDAQNAAILQKFETSGVEVILAPGNAVSGTLGALETSAYRPPVVGTNYSVAMTFTQDPDRDKSVLNGFVATGTYGPVSAQLKTPAAVACGDLMTAAGVEYYTIDEWSEGMAKPWVSALTACASLSLFTAFATKAGPDLNYGTFQWAGDNYGDLILPYSPDPYFYGAAPHADGDPPVFIYTWDETAQDLVVKT
jgi:ABC-type branched-subunit amino acid transport system substrate-binding protein